MQMLGWFLLAVAVTIVGTLYGYHIWAGNYGANFNPDVRLDTSQVIDMRVQR